MTEERLSLEKRAERRSVALDVERITLAYIRKHGRATISVPVEEFQRWCTVYDIELKEDALKPFTAVFVDPELFPKHHLMDRPNILGKIIRSIAEEYNQRLG